MTARERFLEVMVNHNPHVKTLKWEFGYWGETLNNWYRQGLPKNNFAPVPNTYTAPSSSMYTKSWTAKNKYLTGDEYPAGFVSMAGGLYWPTQGFALDQDVKSRFGLDPCQQLVDVNVLFYPMFEAKTLEEDEEKLLYQDVDGVTRLFLKKSATMASGWEWPVKDMASWQKLKAERLRPEDVIKRLPANWKEKVKEYKNRDYPLGLGGYPLGFFGTVAHLLGYEHLFFKYYDEPELIHDMMDTFTNLWINIFEEVLKDVEIDHMQIWEDVSFDSGSMLSLSVMNEFMMPYYKRMTGFLKEHGVKVILVDTDGYCMDIIPFFIEAGATGMYPFETGCGMDIVKVREKFPNLAMMGGIPKSEICKGKAVIDKILEPVQAVLKTGGYIPFGDHFIPPEVDFEGFTYYRETLNKMIDEAAK